MEKKCSVNIPQVLAYIKDRVGKDVKFKNFDEVAKDILNTKGQPDDAKMIVLKALANMYKSLALKNPEFVIDKKADLILNTPLQTADLSALHNDVRKSYLPGAAKVVSINTSDDLIEYVEKLKDLSDYELIEGSKIIFSSIGVMLNKGSVMSKMTIKNNLLFAITRFEELIKANSNVLDKTKDIIQKKLNSIKVDVTGINSYAPLNTTKYGEAFRIYDKNSKLIDQVYLNKQDGQYYSLSNPTKQIDVQALKDKGFSVEQIIYDTRLSSRFETVEHGRVRLLNSKELTAGLSLGRFTNEGLKQALLSVSDPNNFITVVASKVNIKQNQERLKRIQEDIPGRNHETFESYEQQLALRDGNSIATVSSPTKGVSLRIEGPGVEGLALIYDITNYVIVNSDNTTEAIDFSDPAQRELIKKYFKKTGANQTAVELSDYDLQRLASLHSVISQFKNIAADYLEKNGGDEVELPKELYKDVISLGKTDFNRQAAAVKSEQEGALLSSALEDEKNKKWMVEVDVVKTDDTGAEIEREKRSVPILVKKVQREWQFVNGVLDDNEFVDYNGELLPLEIYLNNVYPDAKNVHSIVPGFPQHIGYAMILPKNELSNNYQVIGMNRDYGADPVMNFLKFIHNLNNLKKEISKNPSDQNRLTKSFNIEQYGFSPAYGWGSDLASYVDKKGEVTFHYEIRPLSNKTLNDDSKLKSASRLVFGQGVMDEVTKFINKNTTSESFKKFLADNYPQFGSMRDLVDSKTGELGQVFFNVVSKYIESKPDLKKDLEGMYDVFTSALARNMENVQKKFREAGYGEQPSLYTMLENESKDLKGRWFLKVNDKSVNLNFMNLDQFRLTTTQDLAKASNLYLESPIATYLSEGSTQQPTAPVTPPAAPVVQPAPVSTDAKADIEAKKADIQRRRDISLRGITQTSLNFDADRGYVGKYNIAGTEIIDSNGKPSTLFKETETIREDTKEEVEKELNAKYDAELAALGSKSTTDAKADLFKSIPQLGSIGTAEQYSAYLNSIFPDSKVKDIVYHGTEKTFDKFSKDAEKVTIADQGIFFAPTRNQARNSGKNIIRAIININPLISDDRLERISENKKQDLLSKGYTGYVYSYNKTISSADDIVVFEPEQIHILGSNDDIEGFKNFVNDLKGAVTNPELEAKKAEFEKANDEVMRLANIRSNDNVVRQAIMDSNKGKITIDQLDSTFKKWDDENGMTEAIANFDRIKAELSALESGKTTQTSDIAKGESLVREMLSNNGRLYTDFSAEERGLIDGISIGRKEEIRKEIETKETPGNTTHKITEMDEDPFSLVGVDEPVVMYNDQSYKSELDWFNKNMPAEFKLEDLSKIIGNLKAEGQILGYYKDLTLYVSKVLSGEGSIYHEAFHGIFRNVLSDKDRSFYIGKALQELGQVTKADVEKFRKERGKFHLSDAQVIQGIAEEYLADGYKSYKLNKVEPAKGWLAKFVRLIDKIIKFFTGKSKDIDAITELFNRIDTGYYKNATVVQNFKGEGVFQIIPSRPVITGTKADGTPLIRKSYMNTYEQNQLLYRIAFEVANSPINNFDLRFDFAVSKLLQEYDIEKLVADNSGLDEQKIRNKYTQLYDDYRFILGDPFSTYKNESGVESHDAIISEVDRSSLGTLALLKGEVKNILTNIDMRSALLSDDFQFEEDNDEDKPNGSYEDNYANLNPLDGLSRQFRKFFSLLPYEYKDKDTGVTVTKMVDGSTTFDAIMKISADVPYDSIIENLRSVIDSLGEEGEKDAYNKLNTVFKYMDEKFFGLTEDFKPTRNFNLYNQFISTFFVTEVSTEIIHATTNSDYGTRGKVYDATIQRDISREIEKLKIGYTSFFRMPSDVKQQIFKQASSVIKQEVLASLDLKTENAVELERKAKVVQSALAQIGLNFSKSMIKFSLVNIDKINNPLKEFSSKSTASKLIKNNPILASSGAYLKKDFFTWVFGATLGPDVNIFERTDYDNINLDPEDLEEKDIIKEQRSPQQKTQIDGIAGILKDAARFMIKYNPNAAVSVFQDAQNKNVYRYLKYTPLLLMAQTVKNKGLQGLIDEYPIFEDWFKDNPYFNSKDKELKLYLDNFSISMLGGSRQSIEKFEKEGITFKNMDPRSKQIADLILFSNRTIVTSGKTQIVTYKRSHSILEATSTNFMVPSMYQQLYTKEGFINTTDDTLRAYNFNTFAKFFGKTSYVHPDSTIQADRLDIGERLIENAKAGIPFKDILKKERYSDELTKLKSLLEGYAVDEFYDYLDNLAATGVINPLEKGGFTSELIPTSVKTGPGNYASLDQMNHNLESFLADYFYNDWMSRVFVSQFFDGDAAVTTESATKYGLRNRFAVIKGDSMRDGFHTVAYINKLKVWMHKSDIEAGQYDNIDDVPEEYRIDDNWKNNWEKVDVADGQSYTTVEHRIDMYNKQGRIEEDRSLDNDEGYSVSAILQKSRIERLTNEEIKYIEKFKVVLGSYKTATGGMIEYHKLSEHILLRTDVSYIKPLGTDSIEDSKKLLKSLYSEADRLREYINQGNESILIPEYNATPREALKEIYNDIHSLFQPRPGREMLHNMLNSMEMHGIDQLIDVNASKKGTLLAIDLVKDGITDLSLSSKQVPNKFKMMQVETSGVSRKITNPTQKQQLIDADIDISDESDVPKDLKNAVKNYRKALEQHSMLSLNDIKLILDRPDGEVNITPIIATMRKGLEQQGADANILKFFEIDEKTGKPVYNINLPMRKAMFQNYFFSLYSDNVFGGKVSGRKDFEVSSFGYKLVVDENDNVIKQDEIDKNPEKYAGYKTRYPGVKIEIDENDNITYVVEVIIPKPLFNSKQEEELYLRRLTKMISTRIPTEDKRSMVVAKVVDYIDGSYQNAVIVPQLIHKLAGSDLDIDALYSQTLATYEDLNGKMHVYGEYDTHEGLETEEAKFLEYLLNRSESDIFAGDIDLEYDRILNDTDSITELPDAMEKLKDYLGLPGLGINKENIKERIKELNEARRSYYTTYQTVKQARQEVYDLYVKLRSENEAIWEPAFKSVVRDLKEAGEKFDESDEQFQRSVSELVYNRLSESDRKKIDWKGQGKLSSELRRYEEQAKMAFNIMTGGNAEYADARKEAKKVIKMFEKQLRMIATMNVLAKYKQPVNINDFKKRTKEYVKEVVQNNNMKQQMNILGSAYVFNYLYKNEESSVKSFKDLGKALNESIDTKVEAFDRHTPTFGVNVMGINSNSEGGIGIAATANKATAFMTKFGVRLLKPIWEINGEVYKEYTAYSTDDKDITRVIKSIGKALGMFADAKKEPYPSILNLNETTAGVSLGMIAQGVPETAAYLINKIPLIEQSILESERKASGVQTVQEYYERNNLKKTLNRAMDIEVANIIKSKEKELLFAKDKSGKFTDKLRPIVLSFNFDIKESRTRENLEDLGFTAVYKGTDERVPDNVLQIHLIDMYIKQLDLNNDVLALGKILNLIKKQEPSWKNLDDIVRSYMYLTNRLSRTPNFTNMKDILENRAKEYKPLIEAVLHLYSTSEKVFLERNPVFKIINEELENSMYSFGMSDTILSNLNSYPVKFLLVNKFKQRTQEQLDSEMKSENPREELIEKLKNRLSMLSADFWMNKDTELTPTLEDDVNYLQKEYPDNAFANFIKTRSLNGVILTEALTRMKLDSEMTNSIIDGYNLLQRSLDKRTRIIADKLYMYLLVKDNLGMSNNSFINYLNPSLYKSVSQDLDEIQKILNQTLVSKKGRDRMVKGEPFKEFFNNKDLDLPALLSNIYFKAMSHVGNRSFLHSSRMFLPGALKGILSSKLSRLKSEDLLDLMSKVVPMSTSVNLNELYELTVEDRLYDVYTPDSKELDKGTAIVDMSIINDPGDIGLPPMQEELARALKVSPLYKYESDGKKVFTGWSFPGTVVNSQGQLLRLDSIDGKPVGQFLVEKLNDRLINTRLNSDYAVGGMRAVYKVSQFEGTDRILNTVFSTEDARDLYEFVESSRTYSMVKTTEEFDKFIARMYSENGIPIPALELLQKWVKKDFDKYGYIKFGNKGVYTLKYSKPVSEYEPDNQYILELRPSDKGDGSTIVGTLFLVTNGAYRQTFQKEFKAVEYQTLSKEERKKLRLAEEERIRDEKAMEATLRLFPGLTREEAIERGLIPDPELKKPAEGTKADAEALKYYASLLGYINGIKTMDEYKFINGLQFNINFVKSIPEGLFNNVADAIEQRGDRPFETPTGDMVIPDFLQKFTMKKEVKAIESKDFTESDLKTIYDARISKTDLSFDDFKNKASDVIVRGEKNNLTKEDIIDALKCL